MGTAPLVVDRLDIYPGVPQLGGLHLYLAQGKTDQVDPLGNGILCDHYGFRYLTL